MIGSEEHHGVIKLAQVGERLEDLADVVVRIHDARIIVLDDFLERPRAIAARPTVLGIRAADFVIGVGEGAGFSGISLQVIVKRGGLGNRHAVVQIQITPRPEEGSMGRLEPQAKTEGLFALLFHPPNGPIRNQIVDITLESLRWLHFSIRALVNDRPKIIRGRPGKTEIIVPIALAVDLRCAPFRTRRPHSRRSAGGR